MHLTTDHHRTSSSYAQTSACKNNYINQNINDFLSTTLPLVLSLQLTELELNNYDRYHSIVYF